MEKERKSWKCCSVPSCKASTGKMFKFPKNATFRNRWKELCCIQKSINDHMVVCIRHFAERDLNTTNGRTIVKFGANPSVNLPATSTGDRRFCCSVSSCRKDISDGVTLHNFPKWEQRQLQWQSLCNLARKPNHHYQICSDHFVESDFHYVGGKKTLKSTATPSKNLGVLPSEAQGAAPSEAQGAAPPEAQGAAPPEAQGAAPPEAPVTGHLEAEMVSMVQPEDYSPSVSDTATVVETLDCSVCDAGISEDHGNCSTDHGSEISIQCDTSICSDTGSLLSKELGVSFGELEREVLQEKCDHENKELNSLYSHTDFKKMSASFAQDIDDILKSSSPYVPPPYLGSPTKSSGTQTEPIHHTIFDDIKSDCQLRAFTGVDFATLNCLIKLMEKLKDNYPQGAFRVLNLRNQVLLTLCKLRLNLSFECLGTLFKIGRRRCGEIFSSTLHQMAVILRHVICWPSKEEVKLNMPKCFKKFQDTRIVLDCSEIRVVTPDCLKCKILLYSHYKGGQTIKFMVGVSPSGLITYLSPVYGGKTSDNQIFKESDLISKNLLEPYVDAVMVDKGFRIDQVCDEYGVKIYRPPFIVKKKPLSSVQANQNVDIAHARVHVERVIQRMKIFKILQSEIQWYLMPQIDEVMTVISALVNLGPPIFSDDRFLYFENV